MIALLGLLGVVIAMTVIGVQMTRGRLFTLLTFHAALFLLECGGGAVKASFPDAFYEFKSPANDNPLPYVPLAFVVYIGGFALMLYGYFVATMLTRRTTVAADEAMNRFFDLRWTFGYKVMLLAATMFTLLFGFVQHFFRIRTLGFRAFLETAYMHRFGTATETQGDTAIVVISAVIASSALALVLIWMFAWLRGRLTLAGKFIVLGIIFLLLFRAYASMFRTVILMSIIGMFAAYISERRLGVVKWLTIVAFLGGIFVAVNFFHLYLYYLTAGWNRSGLLASTSEFLGPHAHIHTLASIIGTVENGAPLLGGAGMKESLLFFVPRGFWPSKAPSDMYGTLLVQGWADMPTYFQKAITSVGEWVAHFGYFGVALMFFNGLLIGWLDSFHDRGTVFRAALFGLLLGRVLSDAGMGLSSIAITLVLLGAFLGIVYALDFILAFVRWLFGISKPAARTPRTVPASAALPGGLNAR